MAENGEWGGGGLEGRGRQQTGQEFHWAPRGGKGVGEGLPIGQEGYRNRSPRRERGRDKTACAARVPQGPGQALAQVTAQGQRMLLWALPSAQH